MSSCTGCDTITHKGQWWYCSNYYGISGYFCPCCYDKISHDAYGHPNNPTEYTMMKLKLTAKSFPV